MFASVVREFADHLVDELAPPTTAECEAGDSPRLACRLDRASRVGADDADTLSAIVEVARARNVLDAAQSRLVRAADVAGIPFRKQVRTAAGLLTAIGVPPSVAHRTVRNGHHTEHLEVVGRGMRDGSLSAEMADAVGKGVALIEQRVDLDDTQRQMLARKLVVHDTPGDVATAARREAIRLDTEADDPERVPVAENPALNEMSLTIVDDGRITSTIDVDVLTGEELHAALDPLCRPVPAPDGSPDPRSAGQRRADALGQIIRTYLSGSERPTSGGVLPHATLIVPTSGKSSVGDGDGVARLGFTGPVSATTVGLTLFGGGVGRRGRRPRRPTRCRARTPPVPVRDPQSARGPRRRVRVPRLWSPGLLDRRTPLHPMVRRRRHLTRQRRPPVQDAPRPDPPQRMGGIHRRRRPPLVPTTDRPSTTTPPTGTTEVARQANYDRPPDRSMTRQL